MGINQPRETYLLELPDIRHFYHLHFNPLMGYLQANHFAYSYESHYSQMFHQAIRHDHELPLRIFMNVTRPNGLGRGVFY
jgi:hypothetical protein